MVILDIICILVLLLLIFTFLVSTKDYFKIWQKVIMGGVLVFLVLFELDGLGKAPGLFGDMHPKFWTNKSKIWGVFYAIFKRR